MRANKAKSVFLMIFFETMFFKLRSLVGLERPTFETMRANGVSTAYEPPFEKFLHYVVRSLAPNGGQW